MKQQAKAAETVSAGPRLASEAENRARLEGMAALHALGRIGSGSEVAEAVEHLVCAEWTTGAVLEVDGGLGLGLTNA